MVESSKHKTPEDPSILGGKLPSMTVTIARSSRIDFFGVAVSLFLQVKQVLDSDSFRRIIHNEFSFTKHARISWPSCPPVWASLAKLPRCTKPQHILLGRPWLSHFIHSTTAPFLAFAGQNAMTMTIVMESSPGKTAMLLAPLTAMTAVGTDP